MVYMLCNRNYMIDRFINIILNCMIFNLECIICIRNYKDMIHIKFNCNINTYFSQNHGITDLIRQNHGITDL
jgi:hypothetical protein